MSGRVVTLGVFLQLIKKSIARQSPPNQGDIFIANKDTQKNAQKNLARKAGKDKNASADGQVYLAHLIVQPTAGTSLGLTTLPFKRLLTASFT